MKSTSLLISVVALIAFLLTWNFAPRVDTSKDKHRTSETELARHDGRASTPGGSKASVPASFRPGKEASTLIGLDTDEMAALNGRSAEEADEDQTNDPDRPGFMKGKISEADYIQARNDYLMMRLGMTPGQTYDPMIRVQAIQYIEQQEARLRVDARKGLVLPAINDSTWTNIGPYPIPNGQTSGCDLVTNPAACQPVSGRTTAIAIHPTNPNLVYVGTAQGGVYRSSDGGTTWTQLFNNAQSQVIGAIAISPSNSEIVYVGTGEAGQCGSGCYAGIGVYRIDNASTTADLTGPINPLRNYNDGSNNPVSANVFTGRSISKILVNPTDPSIVFVATASGIVGNPAQVAEGGTVPPLGLRGIYRLANATGTAAAVTATKLTVSVTNCFDTPCTGNLSILDMVYDGLDATGNTIVCWLRPATGFEGGVYRTINALTTATFTNTLTQTSTANSRGELASVTIGGVTTMYLASGESSTGRIRKSIDGGQTWGAALAGASGFCDGQCFYDIAIAIDPTNADVAYVGGAAGTSILRKTTDGFATVVNTPSRQTGLHADNHALTVASAPNNATVYDGTDGGIWRTTDGATTWTSLNNSTFVATQFQSLSMHPTDRWFTIGGTQDNGTEFLQPNADVLPFSGWTRADFGDGGYARIDQTATDTTNVVMYHTYFNLTNSLIGFARTSSVNCATEGNWAFKGFGAIPGTNACGDVEGSNGIAGTDAVLFYAPLELGPVVTGSTGQTVYFGTDRLYRSINKGDTMTVVSNAGTPAPLIAGVPITTIAISPQDDAVRIVGLNNGRVFATTTGGAAGAAMTDVTPPGMAAALRTVGKVLIDPNNHFTAYVAYGGQFGTSGIPAVNHLWKTTNLNAATPTWTATTSGLPDVPINALVVDPAYSSNMYAGTDIGVFVSIDGGATWNPFGSGLPRMAVFDMAFQNANRILRIATHGRGMWEITPLPPNAAPVLDNTGNMSLNAISENILIASNNGTLVSAIIASAGGDRITDIDAGAVEGIAVVAVDNTGGTWQFSIDSGTNWTPFGSPNATTARLLASNATTRVRFVPNVAFSGTVDPGITFRAWDQTSGTNGNTADVSVNGGTTAFSTATETASITVNDGGALQFSSATYNVNENGGSATITITRTGGSAGTATVLFSTSNGTAGAGDYTSVSQTVTFNDGDTSKTVNVPILDDSIDELDETVNLTLSSPGGSGQLGSPATAVLTINDNDPTPTISINDVSKAEGNNGTTSFTFNVTLSAASGLTVKVDYATADGTATAPSDYTALPTTTLTFAPGDPLTKPITVVVNGDTNNEPDETFTVNLTNPQNVTISDAQGLGTILNDDTPLIQFSSNAYTIGEGDVNTPEGFASLTVQVNRSGDTSGAATVRYATHEPNGTSANECDQNNSGNASQRCDYLMLSGTLRFAPGDASKTFQIPIVNDGYVEVSEQFTIDLTNVTGATLGPASLTTVTITDNDTTATDSAHNPYLSNDFFVRMHYVDFLEREPDTLGFADWTSVLNGCGSQHGFLGAPANCDRAHISKGFFGATEFIDRGFLVYRLYEVGLGRLPLYAEYNPDAAQLRGFGLTPAEIQGNLDNYLLELGARTEFATRYASVSGNNTSEATQLIQMLETTAGVTLPTAPAVVAGNMPPQFGRADLINRRATNQFSVVETVKAFVEQKVVYDKEFPRGFVTMQYFAYLHRDPDMAGRADWLDVLLNGKSSEGIAPGDYNHLIFGFIYSTEYRKRFGQP